MRPYRIRSNARWKRASEIGGHSCRNKEVRSGLCPLGCVPIWKNTQKLVSAGPLGMKTGEGGQERDGKLNFLHAPLYYLDFFFFLCACFKKKKLRSLIYSFNKQFWNVKWVVGTKKMRSNDSREALTDSWLRGQTGARGLCS